MKNNDTTIQQKKAALRQQMQDTLQAQDNEAFLQHWEAMAQLVGDEVRQEYEAERDQREADRDAAALAQRGVKQLTSEERRYYTQLAAAMKATSPQQAIENLQELLPTTTINRVFDELQTAHPLLSVINFMPSGGATKLVVNTNGYQMGAWGELCDPITKELTSGFKVIETTIYKLSAFLPVCKAMLDLGPEWLDNYVRQVLYEAVSNTLEYGIVAGTGNTEPIGMIRQVGDGVSVTDGVYPKKQAITVTDFSPATIGNLLSIMAMGPNGKPRQVRDVIMLVNPADYFGKVMPATTLMAPDGTYRNDVLPYPIRVIQSYAVDLGTAVLGIAYRYLAVAGMSPDGRIEYSDHAKFLEDKRVYMIKTYANGMPLDNNAFQLLDISNLQPLAYRTITVKEPEPSDVATLASLSLGSATLTPAFASATLTYTAATTTATNTVNAVPSDAGATMAITVNGTKINNGSAATWANGSNTLKIVVTAEDGTTTKTYTVTVTATLT